MCLLLVEEVYFNWFLGGKTLCIIDNRKVVRSGKTEERDEDNKMTDNK